MRIEYYLKNKNGKVLTIAISEDAKEDFKDMMNWSESKFKRMTCRKFLKRGN
jgi:hypothetical protein